MVRLRARHLLLATTAVFSISTAATAQVQVRTPNVITTAGSTQVVLGGQTFVNAGLVGMGRVPAGTRDFNNDSFGAFSGMDLNLGTWRKTATGYTGGLFALPDRGPNGVGTVTFSDYAARLNSFSMVFTPYTGAANLPAATTSQNQLLLTQTGGLLFRDFNGNVTTGFDPVTGAASVIMQNGIPLPGQSTGAAAGKISLDAEAVRFLRDRSFYVSDEYGSNVYYFDATGRLQGVIRPPAALIPRDATGAVSYSSLVEPTSGRRQNQGLEGMAVTPDGKRLVTLAQSATLQDSTGSQQTRTNTRLMIYDISSGRTPTNPIAHYVLQLPTFTQNGGGGAVNRTAAQSEMLALNESQFLVLSRDGLGLGTATGNSVFKSILLVDISGATNIAGSAFETSTTPVSPGGVLNPAIRPVQQVEIVNMLNTTQLAKFGSNLNNVTPNRLTLAEKWEGMALAPVLEESAPQDFFLFVGNDNDFLASNCRVNNQDCSQAVDSDAHMLIYRLSLPTYVDPEYRAAMVDGGPVALEALGQSGLGVVQSNTANISAHINAARRSGLTASGFTGWASGVYNKADWDDFTAPGVNAKSDGIRGTLGLDYGYNDAFAFGITVGYGDAKTDAGAGFSAKVDGYNLGLSARFTNGGVFINGGYSYGDLKAKDITRPSAYGLTALGNTDATSDSAFASAGYMIPVGMAKVGPVIGFNYSKVSYDAYTETGAAGGNIAVPKHGIESRLFKFGAEVSFDVGGVTPVLQAAYNKETNDVPRNIILRLASATAAMASESVNVPTGKDNFLSAGLGVQGNFGTGLWHVGYTAEFGNDDRFGHVVTAGVGYKF
jgi:uncharacterized protein YhjY with autotransporter beta-barrel domain